MRIVVYVSYVGATHVLKLLEDSVSGPLLTHRSSRSEAGRFENLSQQRVWPISQRESRDSYRE